MVIVKIGDGLGNQMYNYVCGYAVAKHDNDILKMDTSDVDNSTLRSYGLDKFNIDCDLRESFSNRTVFHKIFKRLRRNILYHVIFESESLAADMNVYRKKKIRNKYLHGYFQNYCYYAECKEDIDRQFTPKEPLNDKVLKCIKEFSDRNTCSFHVRGGDIPPLDVSYYKKAVQLMNKQNPDMEYIVFTNDKKTAERYAKESGCKNIKLIWDCGKFTDFDELFLMKACRNHIISDSTFSRWAAFLDDKNAGITAAPKMIEDDSKIYPQNWNIIKTTGDKI